MLDDIIKRFNDIMKKVDVPGKEIFNTEKAETKTCPNCHMYMVQRKKQYWGPTQENWFWWCGGCENCEEPYIPSISESHVEEERRSWKAFMQVNNIKR